MTRSADGRLQASGGAGLKESQTYPAVFGGAVATLLLKYRSQIIAAHQQRELDQADFATPISLDELCPSGPVDTWDDARLGDALILGMQMAMIRHPY